MSAISLERFTTHGGGVILIGNLLCIGYVVGEESRRSRVTLSRRQSFGMARTAIGACPQTQGET